MSVEIIDRTKYPFERQVFNTYGSLGPQIAYNSEGRMSIRIPHGEPDQDTLIVFDRLLTRSLIRFIKGAITEIPADGSYCNERALELTNDAPF